MNAHSDLLDRVPKQLLIDGVWVDASDEGTFTVENPATGEILAELASATPEDAKNALAAAARAQQSWAATSPRTRANLLADLYDAIQEARSELAMLMTLEMGKPLKEADGEVSYGAEYVRWFSEESAHYYGRYNETPEANLRMLVRRKPVGPCLFITPWNFPFAMATRKIAPALAAGCTTILKPARLTPLTSMHFAALCTRVGIPAGVVNVLPTRSAANVSEPILADSRLRKLSFTGSTEVGRALLAKAANNVLRTSMELGGNAPFIVFADADIDQAVTGAIAAKLRNGGEACTAANRILVHSSVAEEFTDKLVARVSKMKVGNGLDPDTDIGPMIEQAAIEKINELIKDATKHGATVRCGGHPIAGPGNFFEATVLADVSVESKIFRNEIFGPVAPIYTFETEDECVRLANDTEFGLASYVYTTDLKRALKIGDQLEYGMVGINTGLMSNAAAPFGGVKQSGLGREGGSEGMLEYTEFQYVAIPN